MTQERFHRLLDNPDLLASISYEEMKTLALAYPYAHNLRYLLALKARQDGHPDEERTLAIAAAYSLDRYRLMELTKLKVEVLQPLAISMEEAVLELKPIDVVQRELEALSPQSRLEKKEQASIAETNAAPPEASPARESAPKPVLPSAAEILAPSDSHPPSKHTLEQPFAVWIARFNPPVLEFQPRQKAEAAAPPPPQETSPPAFSAQELAERSVTENRDVISETLARLLAKQGYRDKAIDMYERLRLAFPEKSAYFAAEIEKLKK